jgi:diacylglycerol O-acyltransferase / wax synthase
MPTRLSGLDAAFLHLETRTAHMHVGSAIVVDPSTRREGSLTRDDIADYLAARLHLAPPFRRRLSVVPFRLDHPVWIEDPDFDLDFHVRRAALPAPGGVAELGEYVGDVMSRPLDRSRPLWEVHVVEGLEDGRVAIVTKTHHAAVDGVTGAELAAALLQLSPDDEPEPPEQEWRPEREPSDVRLLAAAGLRLVGTPLAALRTTRRLLGAAGHLLRDNGDEDHAPAPFEAPATALNGALGAHRRVALAEVALQDVKDVKNALGGTVNDVVLAAVTGALRTFLESRGERPRRPLVAMVPISVHGESDAEGANQVSAMLVDLPVDEDDLEARLHRVAQATRGAKEQHGALGASTIQELAQLAPAGLSALAARLYSRSHAAGWHRPIWNTVVSNVPGPPFPLFLAGARMEAMYPLGPVHEMVGLNITVFSYEDTMFIGCNADRDLLPDVAAVAAAMGEAVDELGKLASARGSGA